MRRLIEKKAGFQSAQSPAQPALLKPKENRRETDLRNVLFSSSQTNFLPEPVYD